MNQHEHVHASQKQRQLREKYGNPVGAGPWQEGAEPLVITAVIAALQS